MEIHHGRLFALRSDVIAQEELLTICSDSKDDDNDMDMPTVATTEVPEFETGENKASKAIFLGDTLILDVASERGGITGSKGYQVLDVESWDSVLVNDRLV